MSSVWPIVCILLFSVATDWVETDWPHRIFRAAACLLAAMYVLDTLRKRELVWNWSLTVPGAAICLGGLQLLTGTTVWRYATWSAVLQWVAYLALYFSSLQCSGLRGKLKLFGWFGGCFSLYATVQFLLWRGKGEPMMGSFPNQNHYAALMELLFPVALWYLFRGRDRGAAMACGLSMVASVAVSGSRTGIVLLLAQLFYVGVRTTARPKLVMTGALLVMVVAAGLMWGRFASLRTAEPYSSRRTTARASMEMIQQRPWAGFGLGSWESVYPAFADRDSGFHIIHADDDWLEWAAEGGIPFFAVMLGFAFIAIRAAWMNPWCVGCAAVMLHSLVEFPLQKQSLWACWLVLLAMGQAPRARWKQAS